jgi:hypothetical protein
MKHQQNKWRLHPNQAQSTRLFAEQNPDKVILYQEQALLKGAAERLDQAAQEQRATKELQQSDILQSGGACCPPQAGSSGAAVVLQPSDGSTAAMTQPVPAVATGACADPAADRKSRPQKLQDPYYSDFLVGLMTNEQRKLLVRFGKNRHVHIDATHGTNNAKVLRREKPPL